MKSTLMLEAYKLCFNEDFDFEKKSNRKKLQAFVFFMQELGVDFGYHFLGLTTGVTSVSLYKEMPFSAMNNCTDNIRLSEYAIYTIAKLKKLFELVENYFQDESDDGLEELAQIYYAEENIASVKNDTECVYLTCKQCFSECSYLYTEERKKLFCWLFNLIKEELL